MKRIYNLFGAILFLCSTMNAQSTFNAGDLCYRITSTTDKTVEVVGLKDKVTDEPTNGPTQEQGVYISETFATSFGVFKPIETAGNYPWVIDYSVAKATSYDSSAGGNNAATSWLVSSAVDFTEETEAYVAFEYIIRYAESGKVAKNHQLLISADYTGDAAAATWTDIPYGAVEGADWQTFYKANVAVPAEFLGKSGIVFALRYTATTKAGIWEVKNFKVAHGAATGETPEEPENPEEAQEYTVAEALAAFTGVATPAIVKGYIVGTVDGQVYTDGCRFSGTAESKTNLLIADNIDETDPANCMPVQLPSGTVRNALNLVDNAGNYQKMVTLTGSLEKYFGVPGLKAVSKYEIEGVTPEEPETPADAYISETFATSFGKFTTQETVGNYPWIIDYSTAKATSYVDTDGDGKADTDKEATSWLVSPTVDFTNETEAYVAFEYIIRYAESGKVADNHQILVSTDYTADVATATWVNIPYGAVEGSDWQTFYKANVAVPAEFLGKSAVTFALRYTATTKAGTWEVKNFVVAHGAATGETPEQPEEPENPDTPDTPVVPSGDNLLANGSFEEWSSGTAVAWAGPAGHNATVSQSTDARTGNYSIAVAGVANINKRLASQSYVLAAGTYTFSVYVKANGTEAGLCRIGYVPIENGQAVSTKYTYETAAASAAPAEWTAKVFEFTLAEQTEVAFIIMNSKNGNGASFLIDDASLICTGKSSGLTAMRSTAEKDSIYKISIPANVVFENEEYRVTGISDWAFMECSGLESVDITDGINSIGYSAFDGCNRLKTVYISSTIETIDDYAFNNCTNILEIKIGAIKAITCSDNIFEEDVYNNATLYIPKDRGFAYARTTPWNKFHSVEMDFTGIYEPKDENAKVRGVYDLQGRMINNHTKGIYIIDGKKVFIK